MVSIGKTTAKLSEILQQLKDRCQLVMVCNRLDEIAEFITHIAVVENSELHCYSRKQAQSIIDQQQHLSTVDFELPQTITTTPPALDRKKPLVKLQNIRVAYSDEVVFDNF